MSHPKCKTEHAGAKNGGGLFGTRAEAKAASRVKRRAAVRQITAEEFDAMFDAGEDITPWLDLDSAILCGPNETPRWAKTGRLVKWHEITPEHAESLGLKPPGGAPLTPSPNPR